MSEKYVPTGQPITAHERELLENLIEEASEVIHAACKVLRFGKENMPPHGTVMNTKALGLEIGDFQEVLQVLIIRNIIQNEDIGEGIMRKKQRMKKYMQTVAP